MKDERGPASRDLDPSELWATMLASGMPFALIDPATHTFVDANEEYAALFDIELSALIGSSVLGLYAPEVARTIEAFNSAFARGTLDSIRGKGEVRMPDGRSVELEGWTRSIHGISDRPLIVTSGVRTDSAAVSDERAWLARGPEAFGPRSDRAATLTMNWENRTEQLEQHLLRIALEVQAAGLVAGAGGRSADPKVTQRFKELSERQREIVLRLLAGENVGEISRTLYLSPSTVRNHLTAVFRRFGVHSQMELMLALRNAL